MLMVLLALMGSLGLASLIDDDSDDPLEELPDEPLTPDIPEDPDIGASFVDDEDGNITIELGDDETRSLAVVYYNEAAVNGELSGDGFLDPEGVEPDTYEARFYLVSETATLSDSSWLSRFDSIESAAENDADSSYTLEDFEADQGLELLGVVDLTNEDGASGERPTSSGLVGNAILDLGLKLYDEVGADALNVTANRPVNGYILGANIGPDAVGETTDSLVSLVPTDYVRFLGVGSSGDIIETAGPETLVSENTTGTSLVDWLVATTEGITLDGQDYDDRLDAPLGNATLIGGEGNDSLWGDQTNSFQEFVRFAEDSSARDAGQTDGYVPDVFASGGLGNDWIILQSGQADGGAGNDLIDILAGEAHGRDGDDTITAGIAGGVNDAVAYGEAGDDTITVFGSNTTAFGDAGDDFLEVSDGATGFGGDGNDRLRVNADGTADGGAGDDLLEVWERLGEDMPAILTGGTGADTFDVRVRNAIPVDALPYANAHITDFDVAEDALQIGTFQTDNRVDTIEIIEDSDANRTDIRVSIVSTDEVETGVVLIRLDGVTGFSEDQIVIVD